MMHIHYYSLSELPELLLEIVIKVVTSGCKYQRGRLHFYPMTWT